MQQLTDALGARIPESAWRLNMPIDSVAPESGKWLVVCHGRTEEFEGVVISAPACVAGKLIERANAGLAHELTSIPYSSSITATFGYDESVRAALPAGFGLLVPRTESARMIAATFVHNKFPGRTPSNKALLRCFLGGTRDEDILDRSDNEIERIMLQDLATILGVHGEPVFCRIYKWQQAMAQYTVGHSARIERIRAAVKGLKGLALAGNAYGGIGVPDCVRSGSEAAVKVLADLGLP